MAVNKVEYKFNSATDGFAEAGDEVTIRRTNADTINQDVEDGRTEELSPGQETYLAKMTNSSDKTDYKTEGSEDDLNGEEGEEVEGEEDENKQEGSAGSTPSIGQFFGPTAMAATAAVLPITDNYSSPIIQVGELALAMLVNVAADSFDGDLGERMTQRNTGDEYIASIDETVDTLNTDLDALMSALGAVQSKSEGGGESGEGEGAGGEGEGGGEGGTGGASSGLLGKLQKLQEDYKNETDETKKEAIKAEMDAVYAEIETALGGEEGEFSPDNIVENNGAAHELADFSAESAKFLSLGSRWGANAEMNKQTLKVTAAYATASAGLAWLYANPFPSSIARGIAGSAIGLTAAGMFLNSSSTMNGKAKDEYSCSDKGRELKEKLSQMNDPLNEHDKYTEILQEIEATKEANKEESTPNSTADLPTADTGGGASPSGGAGDAGGTGGGGSGSGSSSGSSSSGTSTT